MTLIGVLYRPFVEQAQALAQSIQSQLTKHGISSWMGSAWDEEDAALRLPGTDLVIGIGGDGTILHCARVTAPSGIPVLGVKLGQLGFITEISENQVEATASARHSRRRVGRGEGHAGGHP